MEVLSYRTIDKPAEGLYKEKGSRFLSFAFPVQSEAEVKSQIEKLKKEYFDARHHCFAWVLGPEKKHVRAFDDGEPNHSAGDPILGQIRSRDITNVLVVVVRYFGGVKLGVGGLVSAYKSAAEDALDKVSIIEKELTRQYILTFDYATTPVVMKMVKEFDLSILQQNFSHDCEMRIEVALRLDVRMREKVELLQALGANLSSRPVIP
jgi:uncharacterized YigZ family protein